MGRMKARQAIDDKAVNSSSPVGSREREVPATRTSAGGATDEASADASMQNASPAKLLRLFLPLWPSILGLAFGRAGLIVAAYGSYTHTDEGLFTDGAMLVSLAVLLLGFAAITVSKKTLRKCTVNRLMRACVALEAASLLGLACANWTGSTTFALRFSLCALCTLAASGAIFYWLRRCRGAATATAVVFVFATLALSEVELYACTLVAPWAGDAIACALVLLQFPCMRWARKRMLPHGIEAPTQASDYFGFAKTTIQSKQFLIATAIGIGTLSLVIGLLRGYPNGESIAFAPATRAAYGAITIGLSISIIALVLHGKQRVTTVGMFVLMQALACLALILYAAFPEALDIGAMLTTTLNAMMVGFTWYIIIAFMSYGWRDPYYYAIAGWAVWLGSRAVARVALIWFYPISANDMLMNAIMGALIVASTQVVFGQFLHISKLAEEEPKQPQGTLAKIMGLDEGGSLADMRQAAIQHSAESIGQQFLLSNREVEVLALYAQGFTQKRVAEELFISQGTAHAHIKRIYAKTGFHSRQEILDYMEQYTQ